MKRSCETLEVLDDFQGHKINQTVCAKVGDPCRQVCADGFCALDTPPYPRRGKKDIRCQVCGAPSQGAQWGVGTLCAKCLAEWAKRSEEDAEDRRREKNRRCHGVADEVFGDEGY